ncbi:hypothetical protein V1523DRAFT_99972 [Lipomyces doorenjongii]
MLRRRSGSCAGPAEAVAAVLWLVVARSGQLTCRDWHKKVHSVCEQASATLSSCSLADVSSACPCVLRFLPFVYYSPSPFHPRLDQLSLVSLFLLPFSLYLLFIFLFFLFLSRSYQQSTIHSFRTLSLVQPSSRLTLASPPPKGRPLLLKQPRKYFRRQLYSNCLCSAFQQARYLSTLELDNKRLQLYYVLEFTSFDRSH